MKYFKLKIFLALAQFIILGSLKANVGGATLKPGLFGKPFSWQLTEIEIEKEELKLIFQEKEGKRYCHFTAEYFIKCDTLNEFSVSSIFYGLKAQNVEVEYNNKRLVTGLDSANFDKIDSLIFSSTRRTIHKAVWFEWKNLSKTGFTFNFKPNSENVLKISGVIELEPTKSWYGMATPAIYTRHPFLNKSLSEGNEYFHYLITPIETWKSVGSVNITIENSEKLDIVYSANGKRIDSLETNSTREIKLIYTDSIPSYFSAQVIKEKQIFYIGGGVIGFAKNNENGLTNRFGWEFGINTGLINTLVALDYETDYSNYHQFSISAIPSTPWLAYVPNFGLGIGVPIRIEDNSVYSGVGLRADFSWSLFNISLNASYLPNLNSKAIRTNYIGLTF